MTRDPREPLMRLRHEKAVLWIELAELLKSALRRRWRVLRGIQAPVEVDLEETAIPAKSV